MSPAPRSPTRSTRGSREQAARPPFASSGAPSVTGAACRRSLRSGAPSSASAFSPAMRPRKAGPEHTLAKAVNAAMGVLSAELAEAADDVTRRAERTRHRARGRRRRAQRTGGGQRRRRRARARARPRPGRHPRAHALHRTARTPSPRGYARHRASNASAPLGEAVGAERAASAAQEERLDRTQRTLHALEHRLEQADTALERTRAEQAEAQRAAAGEIATLAARADALAAEKAALEEALGDTREQAASFGSEFSRVDAERAAAVAERERAEVPRHDPRGRAGHRARAPCAPRTPRTMGRDATPMPRASHTRPGNAPYSICTPHLGALRAALSRRRRPRRGH